MNITILWGVLIPFLGTSLGAACVFFMKKEMNQSLQRGLTGFAAGVMVAASVWSLLIPALEQAEGMKKLSFLPVAFGFALGMAFLLLLDHVIPHLHLNTEECEGPQCNVKKSTMLVLAVVIHNVPEGMAVGVVYAGWASGSTDISLMAAVALAIGIAIQNFPEGAIISMPLQAQGASKGKAFLDGILSGVVEPLGALLTIFFADFFIPAMPVLLSFAAGAMMYVVVEELIPEMSEGRHSNLGTICFAAGFILMMILDVALG